jgi:hypothetical protein
MPKSDVISKATVANCAMHSYLIAAVPPALVAYFRATLPPSAGIFLHLVGKQMS